MTAAKLRTETKVGDPKPNDPLNVDVMTCGRVTMLLYRAPLTFTEDDAKFMRERDVLLVNSPNLAEDMRAIEVETFRSATSLKDLVYQAAVSSVGYNKSVFCDKLVDLVAKATEKS